ncbi:MAG: hypothetical protein QF824_03185 [Candidatus Woesearchaeota archaeon]|jgi:small subunit ribosomal protein S3Ae|nr:hypothetical protein [Candidatus Woesearchaeota archaeon]
MAETKEEKKILKVKHKKWFQIIAPKLLRENPLGETLANEPNELIGKTVSVNLMNLINDSKKQNINIKFQIKSIKEDKALTEIIGYEIIPASLKRLIRKGKKRVDISFICHTSDNKRIRVKPILLIKITTKGSTETSLRKETVDFLTKTLKKSSYEDILNGLVSHKLQSFLKSHLRKIYPLGICEIRYLAIEELRKIEGLEEEVEIVEDNEEPKETKPAEEKQEETKEESKLSSENEKGLEMSEKRSFSEHAQKSSISDKPKDSQRSEKEEKKEAEPVEEKPEEKPEQSPVEESSGTEPKSEEAPSSE